MIGPDFMIVGAAKAGTTSIYQLLRKHPNLWFPKLKETKFFSSYDLSYPQQGPGDWSIDKYAITDKYEYEELYKSAPNNVLKGEASPDYLLYASKTAKRIRTELGDIPIIICLRNPTYRAYSAYNNLLRDNRETLSFSEALNSEDRRIKEGWDFMWTYKRSGLYFEQVRHYMLHFSKVKVIFFEELITQREETIKTVYDFLEIDYDENIELKNFNPSGKPKDIFTAFILNRNNRISMGLRELIKRVVPDIVIHGIARRRLEKIHIDERDKIYLDEYFKDDIAQLEDLIGRKLNDLWK